MATEARRLAAEGLGTGLLLAAIVGSGIMAQRLTGDVALALLCNAIATGAALFVLIAMFAPISGAHFNPVVTLGAWIDRGLGGRMAALFVLVQCAGAVVGVWVAHLMFSEPMLQAGLTARGGPGQWLAEAVAAFGLVLAIRLGAGRPVEAVAAMVALYIVAAYWFTASTSFANPAVTLARSLTGTFAGIRPIDAPAFMLAQVIGGLAALPAARLLRGG